MHGPQPRCYDYAFPRKKLLGALRSALAAKLADGKLTVVDTLELKEAKTKLYREALDKLDVDSARRCWSRTARRWRRLVILGARNLKGVELVLNNEVHPYDLLRIRAGHLLAGGDRAVAGDSLKKTFRSASCAQAEVA